ncbi:MAG TPA: MFS transporter [Solirubrobacteraceae bacterium]|nr:MFS transporter [Solirubrobacteraceae bacterium]
MQRKWRVSLIVVAGVFMSSLDLFIVNIAFPSIGRHFGGASVSSLSWVLSAYAIVFAALLVPAGRWADALGRKRVFLAGLGVFVAASAACAGASSVGMLVAARIVQAIGGALMLPTSLGLMLPEFEPEKRHVAIGLWAASGGIAAAAGPPLGGLLVKADWRLVFLVNVPVGLAALAFGLRTLREHREQGASRPDVAGAGMLILAVGALVVAIVKGQEWGWDSARVIALFVATLLLLPALWRRSERHATPVVEPSMLRVRRFGLAVGASVIFFSGFGAMLLGGVLFLTGVWHEDVLTAGLMLFPGPAMATAFSIPSARLGARFGYRLPGAVGSLLFASGSLWYIARTGDTPHFLTAYLPGGILTGAGVGLVIPTLTGAGASSLAPERFATGAAVLTMGRQIGAALGVALLVAVLGSGGTSASDFHATWLITVVSGVLTFAAMIAIGPPAKAGVPVDEVLVLDPVDVAELPAAALVEQAAYPIPARTSSGAIGT